MIALKKIDVVSQFCLIVMSVLVVIIPSTRGLLFMGYFFVGGWQLFSAAIHHIQCDHLLLRPARRWYEKSIMLIVILGLFCFLFNDFIIFYLYGLLLFSPCMAVWYLFFSIRELQVWQAKAWVHIK